METDPQYYRTLDRLQKAAEQEQKALFKAMPKDFKERVEGITFRFDDRPSKEMTERGVQSDVLSLTERDAKIIVVFVMNFYDRCGMFRGDFRKELRRVMVQALADWAGMEMDWE